MIEQLILAEHSRNQRDRIIDYVNTDKSKLQEFMSLFFKGSAVVKQRAAYVVGTIEDFYPDVLTIYYHEMVKNLQREGLHHAIPRNTLRVLTNKRLDEEHTGILLDLCFNYLKNHSLPVAIRAFSLTVIYEHGKKYPELMNELKLIIEDHLPFALPAFKYRGQKILKALSKK